MQHTCPDADCSDGLLLSSASSPEKWSVLLMDENSIAEETQLAQLLEQYTEPQAVELRCESCGSTRRGQSQVSIENVGCCLVVGVSRSGGVDEANVWHRHRGRTICSANLTVGKQEFELVALVEHVSESTDARSGHYVTWVKEPRNWKKYDDLRSTSMDVLPETVHGGVVLAFYKKADECQQPVKNLEQPATASGRGRGAEDATSSPSKRTVRAPENAGRPKSPCREAGGRSRGRELLPEEHDGHMEFEEAVESLLAAYRSGGRGACAQQLQALPMFSCEIAEQSWEVFCERLRASVHEYARQRIVAADAVQLASPLWRTTLFPVAVLFETWSRTSGLPTVCYIDSFMSLVGSLLNKHMSYDVAGFFCPRSFLGLWNSVARLGEKPGFGPPQRSACGGTARDARLRAGRAR